jgi:hypothetical protein
MRNTFTIGALFVCTLVVLNPTPASAQGHVVEAGVRFWKPSPELVLSTGGLTGVGLENVDFVEDFGLEDETFRQFKASIGRNHKFRISKVSFHYDAEATIQKTIVFQGQVFTVGAPASTDIKWDLWTFGYEWDFISRDGGFLGLVADLKYNKVVASIESPALASVADTDVTAPIPTIGLIGRAYLGSAGSITTEFTGLSLSRDNDGDPFEGKFYDFDIYGTIHLGGQLGIEIGYRSVDAHYLVDGDSGDLKMKGPYFGGTLRF